MAAAGVRRPAQAAELLLAPDELLADDVVEPEELLESDPLLFVSLLPDDEESEPLDEEESEDEPDEEPLLEDDVLPDELLRLSFR
jgi:hypothetical protein